MFRRFFCILLVLCFLCSAAFAEKTDLHSVDFSLDFAIDGDSFPSAYRLRARGYAALIDRLTAMGNLTWCTETESFDLNASFFFRDKPDIAIRFHMYGFPGRIFISSPLIADETVMLNMYAFLEFTVKTKNTLGIDMPWLAMLYPLCTEQSFSVLSDSWNEMIGPADGNRTVSRDLLEQLSEHWNTYIHENVALSRWISAFSALTTEPYLVQDEFTNLPEYLLYSVCENSSLTVSDESGSLVWSAASGRELFSRSVSDLKTDLRLSLPATANGYIPYFTLNTSRENGSGSLQMIASYTQPSASSAEESGEDSSSDAETETSGIENEADPDAELMDDEVEAWNWGDEGEDESYPAEAAILSVTGSGFPLSFPDDSEFSLILSCLGALLPNYTFDIRGTTKKDGSVTVSVYKPFDQYTDPVAMIRCSGTVLPVEAASLPDHRNTSWEGAYNVLSFSETSLAEFRDKAYRPLIRGLLDFVAEAPASALQSFLDDLTELGILDFILEQ